MFSGIYTGLQTDLIKYDMTSYYNARDTQCTGFNFSTNVYISENQYLVYGIVMILTTPCPEKKRPRFFLHNFYKCRHRSNFWHDPSWGHIFTARQHSLLCRARY